MFPLLAVVGMAALMERGTDAETISGRWINEGSPTLVEGPANAETLRFVQVLWRHGDRTPALLLPTDTGNVESTWPEGLGELTTVGMRQQYRLGQWLRKRYDVILGSRWNRTVAYIRSSDYNRTLMSAQANLAGLFPPSTGDKFSDISWQPIPVHTVPKEIDVQLYEDISCPAAEADRDRTYREFPRALEIAKQNEALFKFLSEKTGKNPVDMRNIWEVYDPLMAELCHNTSHKWPTWLNESTWQQLEKVYDDSSRFSFHTALLRRLRGGPLVQEVLDRFRSAADGKLGGGRMYAYSAHDTTLAAILATFGIFPVRFPLYATAIMIEMHERQGQFYIEMYHKNATDSPTLYQHEMEGCPSPCLLTTLKEAMSPYAPADWRSECGLPPQGPTNVTRYIAVISILALLATLFAAVLAVDVGLKYRERRSHMREDAGREAVARLLQPDDEEGAEGEGVL